jgi:hydroxymethylbilane synthase
MNPIKIGTRGSQLALWQAHEIEKKLKMAGISSEIVIIDTKGDKILNTAIAKIGSKGVFTEELEEQLRKGTIDVAVHSAKDMQSDVADDLEILAFTEREQVHDVIVSYQKDFQLNTKNKIILGTSSTRRVAMMKSLYPSIRTIDVRGNLQTRMRKLSEGLCDALVLAYAGVFRMNYAQYIVKNLSVDEFTPAVGQGSIAIEIAKKLDTDIATQIKLATNHTETEYRVRAERSFLKTLQGGCSIPTFALAQVQGSSMSIKGGLISLDGKTRIEATANGTIADAEKLGKEIAEKVLAEGGEAILADIRRVLEK